MTYAKEELCRNGDSDEYDQHVKDIMSKEIPMQTTHQLIHNLIVVLVSEAFDAGVNYAEAMTGDPDNDEEKRLQALEAIISRGPL